MKKILLAIMFVLLLSGCDTEEITYKQVYYNEDFPHKIAYGCSDTTGDYTVCENYIEIYTQEEVDQLLLEQSTELLQFMVDNMVQYNEEDNAIYADCYIRDSIKYCDIVLDLDEDWALLTENQYTDLLQRIEELESATTFTYQRTHKYNETQYFTVTYTLLNGIYNPTVLDACIEICEVWEYPAINVNWTLEEFNTWWDYKITVYQDYIEEAE